MTPVDYLIVVVCLLSIASGLWRGLAREALSLLSLLVAIWVAWRFSFVVEPYLGDWAGNQEAKTWVGRVAVFVLVLIAGALVGWFARTLIRASGLSGVDRLLGGLFGAVRGGVLVGLGVIALEFAGLDQDPLWQQARLKPYADRAAAIVRYYAELGTRYIDEQQAA